MKILNTEQMRAIDRRAIEGAGIPGLVLMENAAVGVTRHVAERFPQPLSAAIVCGPGNNGADGLAIARHLDNRFWTLEVYVVRDGRPLSGDAQVQHEICRYQGVAVRDDVEPPTEASFDLVIDALFGTGLGRPLAGAAARWVTWMNDLEQPVVAVDLPSGLDASRSQVPGLSVEADLTVTFCTPKVAHILDPAADRCGEIEIVDIGIPRSIVAQSSAEAHLLVEDEMAAHLRPRNRNSYKGDYGHTLIVAGRVGCAGAAALTAGAAHRTGAGLVTLAVPAGIATTVAAASLESMTVHCNATPGGGLSRACDEQLRAAVEGKSALGIGPGLGTESETTERVRELVRTTELPMVIDADGLNAFAGQFELLAKRRAAAVLTPHVGELARLLDRSKAEIVEQPLEAVRRAARTAAAVVVLKGHRTLIAEPGGEVFVNSTGNAGMAAAGSGDVLTGVIASLLGQGYTSLVAAQLGVFVHGAAGDRARESVGESGLIAGDLVASLGPTLQALTTGEWDAEN